MGGSIFMMRADLLEKLYKKMGRNWDELVLSSPVVCILIYY